MIAKANLQWKGTDACVDIVCGCGEEYHYDGYFMYYVRCNKCKRVYMCSDKIELIECMETPDSECIQELKD